MAIIDKRPDGRYRARWREFPGGAAENEAIHPQGRCRALPRRRTGRPVHGTYVDPAGRQVLFRDYAERWRTAQMHRLTTAVQAETYLRLHAYPTSGKRSLGAVRRSEIQAWVKYESTPLAPGSVELVYRWVSTIFKSAVSDRLIASSPCVGITLPKRDDGEVVPLSVAQVEALAEAVPDRHRALIVFASGTGLRQGVCFGLSVDRLDFLKRQCESTGNSSRPGFGAGVRAVEERWAAYGPTHRLGCHRVHLDDGSGGQPGGMTAMP